VGVAHLFAGLASFTTTAIILGTAWIRSRERVKLAKIILEGTNADQRATLLWPMSYLKPFAPPLGRDRPHLHGHGVLSNTYPEDPREASRN
jgi:hypothetical protein